MDIKAPLKRNIAYISYSAITVVSIIVMLLGIRFSLMEGHEEIKKYVATNIGDIESSFTKESETVLKGLGEEIIRLRAEKVAKDIENYLIRYPRATIKDMQNDPQFKPIAIQPVGKTGYTAAHDSKRSINLFHVNPKVVDANLDALVGVLPDFWKIIVASKGDKNAGGYYKWREADGSVREKYMWVTTVSRPTADGIILDVAATTYIDEFMQPLAQLSEKFHREISVASARVVSASERTQGNTLIAIGMLILIFCVIAGYMVFRLIQGYRRIEREIEERKKLESELQKLAAIVEQSGELVNLATLDGKMIFLNKAGGTMLGIPPGDVEKHSIMDVIPDELKSRVENELLPAALKEGRWEGDLQYRNLITGALTDVHAMTFTIRNADGEPLYLANVSLDITGRKQAEEALQVSEERYRTILNEMGEGYQEVDLAGNFTFFNEAFLNIFGYSSDEMMGANFSRFAAEEAIAKKVYRVYDEMYKTGLPIRSYEWDIIIKDGARRTIEFYASVLRDSKDHPTGFRGIVHDITDRRRAEERLQETLESLRKALGTTVQVLVSAVETRDPYTAGHQIRATDLARAIATEMELSQDTIEAIRMAGPIHDIGKISIPAEILSKPTKLTEIEFSLIKEHARTGYEMLKDVESPWPLAQIVYQHHERMDGSGYPRNLKGDEILMEARVLSVADVVEAMASHRPYRPGLGIDAALNEIEKNRGTHYDNTIADACLRLFREKGYQLTGT